MINIKYKKSSYFILENQYYFLALFPSTYCIGIDARAQWMGVKAIDPNDIDLQNNQEHENRDIDVRNKTRYKRHFKMSCRQFKHFMRSWVCFELIITVLNYIFTVHAKLLGLILLTLIINKTWML